MKRWQTKIFQRSSDIKKLITKDCDYMKLTKMVCTLGPASENPETMRTLVDMGMTVARLNFSHNTHASHKGVMKTVRQVSADTKNYVGILQDLQGPKIRMSDLAEPILLTVGQNVILGKGGIPVQYDLSQIVSVGQRILIDDGLVELEVTEMKQKAVSCVVIVGGTVISHKGINVPESATNFSVFTKKDQTDLAFGLKNGVDFVAMSFVRTAKDILEVKAFIKKNFKKTADNAVPWVIAKIEKPEAITNIDSIIEVSDGIMVARGDLGIETPEANVPVLQKMIIKKCLLANKPVITATQMLDSMMRNPRPTRAEVSDVANAVLDRTDATMLSGESAYGKYPKESVSMMAKAAIAMEVSEFMPFDLPKKEITNEGVVQIAQIAKKNTAPMLIYSPMGTIAKEVSRLRLNRPLFVFSENETVLRKLSLVFGVFGILLKKQNPKESTEQAMIRMFQEHVSFGDTTEALIIQAKALKTGDSFVSAQLKTLR